MNPPRYLTREPIAHLPGTSRRRRRRRITAALEECAVPAWGRVLIGLGLTIGGLGSLALAVWIAAHLFDALAA